MPCSCVILPFSVSLTIFSALYTKPSASFLTSTASLLALSSSANFSASSLRRLISSSDSFVLDSIVILASFCVPRSFAVTLMIPLASMSNFTSIWGVPRGAGGRSVRLKLPSETLSAAMGLSPCTTWIVTAVWLSAAVVNVLLFDVGMVVLRSMSGSRMLPSVSIPSVSGVTSSRTMSLATSPAMIPACIAAPIETASMGSTPDSASRPTTLLTNRRTDGILVGPPTMTIFATSDDWRDASASAFSIDARHLSIMGPTRSSSFARVRRSSRFLVPDGSLAMNGRFTSVSITVDSSIFAFSAASRTRVIAVWSSDRSMPSFFLNSSTTWSMSALSMSAPPSCVSPDVLRTSNTPPPISMMVTSSVPPPKSNTSIFMSSPALSRPNASDAAVGSLIMRTTSRPAIVPASFVAWRWLSSK